MRIRCPCLRWRTGLARPLAPHPLALGGTLAAPRKVGFNGKKRCDGSMAKAMAAMVRCQNDNMVKDHGKWPNSVICHIDSSSNMKFIPSSAMSFGMMFNRGGFAKSSRWFLWGNGKQRVEATFPHNWRPHHVSCWVTVWWSNFWGYPVWEWNTVLVGGLGHEFYDFPYTGNVIIPTDELIFFPRGWNHQPEPCWTTFFKSQRLCTWHSVLSHLVVDSGLKLSTSYRCFFVTASPSLANLQGCHVLSYGFESSIHEIRSCSLFLLRTCVCPYNCA